MKYAIKTVIYKSWDWVRPPPPSLGQIPNFYRKFVLQASLRVFRKSKSNITDKIILVNVILQQSFLSSHFQKDCIFLPSLEYFLQVGSYIPAFIAAGIPPIVGSLLMVTIRQLLLALSSGRCFSHNPPGSCPLLWTIWTNLWRRKVLMQRRSCWRLEGGKRRRWWRRWRGCLARGAV